MCPEWTPATSYPAYLEWKAAGSKNPTASGAITVESQDADPASLLNWTRALVSLRKSTPAFWADSRFEPVFNEAQPYPMLYYRTDGKDTYLIALNPTSRQQTVTLDRKSSDFYKAMQFGKAKYKLTRKGDRLTLGPVSALIVKLD